MITVIAAKTEVDHRRHAEAERRHTAGRCRDDGLALLEGSGEDGFGHANEGVPLRAEGHAVAPQAPYDHHRSEGIHRHEGGVDGPFLLDDTAVEDNEARHALQRDERSRRQLPGVVA
jgi:hypothetical protein